MSCRRMEEWIHRSIFAGPRQHMEVSGQAHFAAALPGYPLDRRLGGPQSWSGRHGEGLQRKQKGGGAQERRGRKLRQQVGTEVL
jgi:hypothetical protein